MIEEYGKIAIFLLSQLEIESRLNHNLFGILGILVLCYELYRQPPDSQAYSSHVLGGKVGKHAMMICI
jgi:hypothetical protein